MTKWITVAELAAELGISSRAVRKQIAEGKWTAKKRGTHWVIQRKESSAVMSGHQSEQDKRRAGLEEKEGHHWQIREKLFQQTEQVNHLKQLLVERERVIGQLQENQTRLQQTLSEVLASLSEADSRSDTIIMTLTQQVKQQQRLIEDLRQRPTSLWQRFKKRIRPKPPMEEPC